MILQRCLSAATSLLGATRARPEQLSDRHLEPTSGGQPVLRYDRIACPTHNVCNYTTNGLTSNVSVFDATGQPNTVVDVINLKCTQTSFGSGGISGVAVDASAKRLYVYATVATSVYGGSVVLLVVDTATNELVEPSDPDGDTWPGLTLFTQK